MHINLSLSNEHGSREDGTSALQPNGLNIMIVGLGGLGVVSLTQKLRNLIASRYLHVHTTEQRGVAQRRASTSALIKAADGYVSLAETHAGVDVMIALEPLEALRYSHLLKPGAQCFVSDFRIETIGGCQGKFSYPETSDIVASIRASGAFCLLLPIANWLKNEAMLSVHASSAMLGLFCAAFGFDHTALTDDKAKTAIQQKNAHALEWGFNQYAQQTSRYPDMPKAASPIVFTDLQPVFVQ